MWPSPRLAAIGGVAASPGIERRDRAPGSSTGIEHGDRAPGWKPGLQQHEVRLRGLRPRHSSGSPIPSRSDRTECRGITRLRDGAAELILQMYDGTQIRTTTTARFR